MIKLIIFISIFFIIRKLIVKKLSKEILRMLETNKKEEKYKISF